MTPAFATLSIEKESVNLASRESRHVSAYEEYYGLFDRPFSLTPDLRFVYPSLSHSRAFEQVIDALQRREGLIVVTGESGTGKTVLCRTVLDTFEPRTFVSVILDPCLTVNDLLRQVLTDFGLITRVEPGAPPPVVDRHHLVSTLQRFLSTLISVDGHAVIVIDEAQHLDPTVLEQIRLLSNFETDTAKLLQIVLVGQPNLDETLNRPDMQQLDQRVARRFELHPLSAAEVREYIERRLFVAARDEHGSNGEPPSDGVRFTPKAVAAVARLSGGIPRLINTICDQALEIGFEKQTTAIDRPVIVAAARRLNPRAIIQPRFPATTLAVAAMLFLTTAAAGTWWWSNHARARVAPQRVPASLPIAAGPTSGASTSSDALHRDPATIQSSDKPPTKPIESLAPTSEPAVGDQSGGFEVAVAAFRTAQRAEEVAYALTRRGLPASTRSDSGGAWHRIVVGPLDSRDAAESAQRFLADQGFPETTISASRRD